MHATRRLPACAVIVVAAVCAANASAQPAPRTVLTIHTGAENYPANPILDAGIRDGLQSRPDVRVDYFAEYLEADLFPGEAATAAFRDYLRAKYARRRIDVVITVTSAALEFAIDHRAELFPGAPIVFGALVADDVLRRAPDDITGIRIGTAYAETMNLALTLHPSARHVYVVANGEPDQLASVRAQLERVGLRTAVTFVREQTIPRLLDAIRRIPAGSVVLYVWQAQTEPGNIRYPDDIAPLVVRASPVPVYGSSDLYIGSGVVGGVVRSTHETGVRLGQMTARILTGTRPQSIPIEMSAVAPVVDWRAIQRWHIDPRLLPPGTDVRFRTPTAWEAYRSYILGTAVVVAAQMLLIGTLLVQRARRRRAEQRIRQLNSRLITAQESTRAEIARELHDDVCQELVGLAMRIDELWRARGSQAQDALSELHDVADHTVESVRHLSHELHPAALRLIGLPAALRTCCVEVERRHDVQVTFNVDGDFAGIDPDVEVALFRIAQEALRNAAIHGDARRLAVSVASSDRRVALTVADDGTGFDVAAERARHTGLGLTSIEERVHLAGGDMWIDSRPGLGTTVRVRMPRRHSPSVEVA